MCVARVLGGSAVVICECVGGTVMGGCCVLIAVLRVAPIGFRTACGAIAFSVLALMQMLIRVAVLALFCSICKFHSVLGGIGIVCVLVHFYLLPVFHFIQFEFRSNFGSRGYRP